MSPLDESGAGAPNQNPADRPDEVTVWLDPADLVTGQTIRPIVVEVRPSGQDTPVHARLPVGVAEGALARVPLTKDGITTGSLAVRVRVRSAAEPVDGGVDAPPVDTPPVDTPADVTPDTPSAPPADSPRDTPAGAGGPANDADEPVFVRFRAGSTAAAEDITGQQPPPPPFLTSFPQPRRRLSEGSAKLLGCGVAFGIFLLIVIIAAALSNGGSNQAGGLTSGSSSDSSSDNYSVPNLYLGETGDSSASESVNGGSVGGDSSDSSVSSPAPTTAPTFTTGTCLDGTIPDSSVAVEVTDVNVVDCSSSDAHYRVIQTFPGTTDLSMCDNNPQTQYEFSEEDTLNGIPTDQFVYCLVGLGSYAR